MSGQKSIENEVERIALDFVTVYKRYRDKSSGRAKGRNEENETLPGMNPTERVRLDKHPC